MLSKLLEHKVRIIITIFIVMCFGLIRTFESQLFYDPFLDYFESNFKNWPFPPFDVFKLFCGLFFRYFLNTILSLILIYTLFRDREILKFSTFLYVFFFSTALNVIFCDSELFP